MFIAFDYVDQCREERGADEQDRKNQPTIVINAPSANHVMHTTYDTILYKANCMRGGYASAKSPYAFNTARC